MGCRERTRLRPGAITPGSRGLRSRDLQVCSLPQSSSPFPLTASVSTDTRLHGLGEERVHRSPCTAPLGILSSGLEIHTPFSHRLAD